MSNVTIYEVKYFNVFTDTTYTATTDNISVLKQFLSQLNSHNCILMLAGKTTTIREYIDDEYYPDDTTLSLYTSDVDDTSLYLNQFMMEQAREIIYGDIAYFASSLPEILMENVMPYCRGMFRNNLVQMIIVMTRKVIVESKDSCVDIIKGICSPELFFSRTNQRLEYPFDGEGD